MLNVGLKLKRFQNFECNDLFMGHLNHFPEYNLIDLDVTFL